MQAPDALEVIIDGEPVITEGSSAEVDLSGSVPEQAETVVTNSYDHPDTPPTPGPEPTTPGPEEPGDDMPTTGAPLLPFVVATLALLLLGLGMTQLRPGSGQPPGPPRERHGSTARGTPAADRFRRTGEPVRSGAR